MNHLKRMLICISFVSMVLSGSVWASDTMKMDMDHSGAAMSMHHMHVMLNQAMSMAAQGSNLIMVGQMGMAKGVDEISIQQGKKMIDDAENLATEVLSGKAMTDMHKHGHGPQASEEMAYTHTLGNAVLDYIKLVRDMSVAPAHN